MINATQKITEISESSEESQENKIKKNEFKQKLESLVNDNNNLKKSVLCLYKKYEVGLFYNFLGIQTHNRREFRT